MEGKHSIHCKISEALRRAIDRRCADTGQTLQQVVCEALEQYLLLEGHTLFQTSTVGALIEGVDEGTTTIEQLKAHGDFGIGTFDHLDGEMIELEGKVFQIRSDGHAYPASNPQKTPFATVAFWQPDVTVGLCEPLDYPGLQAFLDRLIPERNLFQAIKIEGRFSRLKTRSVARQPEHTRLAEAAASQAEFEFRDIEGTLAGFWTPPFAAGINVPGYHLHFISAARKLGGHLLECTIDQVTVQVHHTPELHLAVPRSPEFQRADLAADTGAELDRAEK
ncbi:acetolactate decarboxylase [Gloeobacter morelensis]|nr:acetolactate decarboxylase [Gloeobacter morelensis]